MTYTKEELDAALTMIDEGGRHGDDRNAGRVIAAAYRATKADLVAESDKRDRCIDTINRLIDERDALMVALRERADSLLNALKVQKEVYEWRSEWKARADLAGAEVKRLQDIVLAQKMALAGIAARKPYSDDEAGWEGAARDMSEAANKALVPADKAGRLVGNGEDCYCVIGDYEKHIHLIGDGGE